MSKRTPENNTAEIFNNATAVLAEVLGVKPNEIRTSLKQTGSLRKRLGFQSRRKIDRRVSKIYSSNRQLLDKQITMRGQDQ